MTATAKTIRVLIVDDHPLLRQSIVSILEMEEDFSKCDEAGDIESALALIEETTPDVVILDLTLKNGDGLDALRTIKERFPGVKVVILSGREESVYAPRSLRAGASGFVRKEEPVEKLLLAIRKAMAGGLYVSEELESHFLKRLRGENPSTKLSVETLSDRELQVFRLYGEGVGTNEIAAKLGLSSKTVETHRANIKEKLNLKTADAMLRSAIDWVHH